MPTITIKQINNTSAGVLRQPKNVFLMGQKASSTASGTTSTTITADSNGVYYFTSAVDFNNTIGKCEPIDCTYTNEQGESTICKSYGNQMAAELLNLGYNIYYYPIGSQATEPATVADELSEPATGADNGITGDTSDIEDPAFIDITSFIGAAIAAPGSMDCLADISLYPIDYIVTGFVGAGCYDLIKILKDRAVDIRSGDCLLLVDMPTEDNYLKCINGNGTVNSSSSLLVKLAAETHKLELDNYCAPFAPVCEISGLSAIEYKNSVLPASFYYLACAINAEENLGYKEWFAVAGLTRGRRTDHLVTPTVAFGDRDATTCAPRLKAADGTAFNYAINLVARQASSFYIWGNRTGAPLDEKGLTAEHFLNIQRLCMSLKKRIYSTCKKLTFDPNSDILWSNFVGGIEPLLKDMQANQGINGYKIIRLKSANDPKAMMRAKIRIIPIEAVEDFEIEIALEDLIEA